MLRNKLDSRLIECDEPSARNCSSKNDCCIVSPVNSVSNGQQEIFFENQNNKIFLDKAALIQYDGSNMAFIFFKNRIEALINECPSKGMKLMLLETACVKSASQIIINLVADNPNLSELKRVDMSLRRLELRFGTKGGFLGEPDVRRYRYGPKLTSGSADAIRRFKVDLDNCALYASAYKKTEKLEGRFVLDLAKRLPPDFRQRYLDFLLHHFESTNEPSFQSLVDFVNREEALMSTEFGFMLLGDESEHKRNGDKAPVYRVRQTVASSDLPSKASSGVSYGRRDYRGPPERDRYKELDPLCIFCETQGRNVRHVLSKCSDFLKLSVDNRKKVVVESGRCLNCLGNHFLRDCSRPNNCRKCGPDHRSKHYFLLHDHYVLFLKQHAN